MTVTISPDMKHQAASTYLSWVKTRQPGRYNLAGSGVVPYSIRELAARIEDVQINGQSLYGYAPLQAAIAAHCGVPGDCVIAASGKSMANFFALEVFIVPGGRVPGEEQVYETILGGL